MQKRQENEFKKLTKQKGIWKRFFHTIAAANIPYGLFVVYAVITFAEGAILVRIPEVNANLFTGDVSVESVLTFLGFEILNMVVSQFILFMNHLLRYKMNRNLRNALWGKVLRLKPSYYDRVPSSSLLSRITVDADAFNEFVLDVVLELFVQIYYLTLYIREMSEISVKAGFMLLAFLPLTVIVTWLMGRIEFLFSGRMKHQFSDLTSYLSELITCLPLLKSLNRQAYEEKRGEETIRKYYEAQRNMIGLDIMKEMIGTLVGIGPEIVIILMGIKMLSNGTVDAAGWYTFYLYAGTFIVFCNTLGSMWQRTKGIQGQLVKVSDVLYEEEALEGYAAAAAASGDLIFDGVDFSYGEDRIFDHITLTFPGKKNTMLIGHSGSGKSTILKLVERVYEPDAGRILLNGTDILACGIKDWRKKIAFVSQNTPLLSGTIRDNILYGVKREVSDEEILKMASMAHLREYIESLPEGLEHQVGQFGDNLSGGQKQKISIVRALLGSAEILILDEPTASLDIVSTGEIMHTLEELKGSRTILVVTHDARVVEAADHVIVVKQDHTVEEGSRKELIRTSEYYRQMMQQMDHRMDEEA